MRVLVVEDEPEMFLEIETAILQEGGEVIGVATTQAEALELAPDADIALVDIHLGDGMTGPVIAKSLVDGFGIGVVYVTNNARSVKRNNDAIGLLEKPVTREAVRRALQLAAAFRTRTGRRKPN